jgi:hypothetical protein
MTSTLNPANTARWRPAGQPRIAGASNQKSAAAAETESTYGV